MPLTSGNRSLVQIKLWAVKSLYPIHQALNVYQSCNKVAVGNWWLGDENHFLVQCSSALKSGLHFVTSIFLMTIQLWDYLEIPFTIGECCAHFLTCFIYTRGCIKSCPIMHCIYYCFQISSVVAVSNSHWKPCKRQLRFRNFNNCSSGAGITFLLNANWAVHHLWYHTSYRQPNKIIA